MDSREQRSPSWSIAAGVALALAVATIDVVTGYEINLGLFYLAPIAIVTWQAGRLAGITMGTVCVVGMHFIDFHVTRDIPFPSHDLIPYWNAGIRLGYFVVFAYILSALKAAHERERSIARRDFLTDVANGQEFFNCVGREITRARRSGRPFSLAYVDFDDFKLVNDRFGHAAGDEVLRQAAGAMAGALGTSGVVARLGGDEFAVLLGDASEDEARTRIDRMHAVLAQAAEHWQWPVTFSIGVTTFVGAPKDARTAICEADRLMYAVKARGKNGVAYCVLGDDRPGNCRPEHSSQSRAAKVSSRAPRGIRGPTVGGW